MKTDDTINILLVDDLNLNLLTLEYMLKNPSYRLIKAHTGDEALTYLEKMDFALIILDVYMPGKDGFETAGIIRQKEKTKDIPIIFVTAERKDKEFISKGYALNAVDYIIKPFDADILKSRVALIAELYRKNMRIQEQKELLAASEKELKIVLQKRNAELKQLELEMAEREKIEQLLEKRNIELEWKNKELEEFAYSISHDLREPLRGIHNFSNFLLEDYFEILDRDGRKMLETVTTLSRRLESEIRAILELSRIGRKELSYEKIPLDDILSTVLSELTPTIESANAKITTSTPLPAVFCDKTYIPEVFRHLILNAVQYNDNDHKQVEIGYTDKKHVNLSPFQAPPLLLDTVSFIFYIKDNGIGIEEKHFDNIFRIFKRLHAKNKYGGGTGMGLATVKKIIERHNGVIWVESSPGKGSTFYFTIGDFKPAPGGRCYR